MSRFAADWLALREPADREARNPLLTARLAEHFRARDRLRIVDLGSGTGSTARAVAGLLGGPQHWRLVDHDRELLARAATALAAQTDRDGVAIAIETVVGDLAAGFPPGSFDGIDLVTLSAVFDLVGRTFLERLAVATAATGAAVYAALTVDGRLECAPADPLDTTVFDAFNLHMTRDKGFGPALGPRSPDVAVHVFRAHGYRVEIGRSDWRLGAADADLALALLDGWTTAAGETGRVDAADLARWHRRRAGEIAAGTATFGVGHIDLFALPD